MQVLDPSPPSVPPGPPSFKPVPFVRCRHSGETDPNERRFDGKTFVDSHGRNEFRPPIELLDIAGNLYPRGIGQGNPSPDNQKELLGGTTDTHRCCAGLAPHASASPV